MRNSQNHVMLELKDLTKSFGGIDAVNGLNVKVLSGESIGLIGPNGAGKTTVFNLVSGVLKPTRGEVILRGENITRLKPSKIAKRGLVRTFQASNILFNDYTVTENVAVGRHLNTGMGFLSDLFNTSANKKKQKENWEKAKEIVSFIGLSDYRNELAKNLSHGHQRILGIGIALASEPDMLMLDEPTSGMNLQEKMAVVNLAGRVQESGITVLMVEHDMRVVMGFCQRIVVINFGVKIAEGIPDEIRSNKQVIEAYLGAE